MPIIIRAPYRIFDCGGWTDTSFMPGGKGVCTNVAISLYVHVKFTPDQSNTLTVFHEATQNTESITLPIERRPETLAEAAAKALELGSSDGGNITVTSDVPHGSGLGGSATYSVALIAALQPKFLHDKHGLAAFAQKLETEWLGNSCGTQDQMGAAFGSISTSQITYPDFTHESINLDTAAIKAIEDGLILVYTGASHFSSEMHMTVVQELLNDNQKVVNAFYQIKDSATEATEALRANDLNAYKMILNKNWSAQKDLHPKITTEEIEQLHHIVEQIDPDAGFKGSGAGGGGSIACLVDPLKKAAIVDTIHKELPHMMVWDNLTIDLTGATLLEEAPYSE